MAHKTFFATVVWFTIRERLQDRSKSNSHRLKRVSGPFQSVVPHFNHLWDVLSISIREKKAEVDPLLFLSSCDDGQVDLSQTFISESVGFFTYHFFTNYRKKFRK